VKQIDERFGGRAGLRYLALNDPEIAVTSGPRVSGE
jgi:hypothetical protein